MYTVKRWTPALFKMTKNMTVIHCKVSENLLSVAQILSTSAPHIWGDMWGETINRKQKDN